MLQLTFEIKNIDRDKMRVYSEYKNHPVHDDYKRGAFYILHFDPW